MGIEKPQESPGLAVGEEEDEKKEEELLLYWRVDEGKGEKLADLSNYGLEGYIVNKHPEKEI